MVLVDKFQDKVQVDMWAVLLMVGKFAHIAVVDKAVHAAAAVGTVVHMAVLPVQDML